MNKAKPEPTTQPVQGNGEFEAAVQQRIDRLMQNRTELLSRFDFDGNGEIDAFEMSAIRHIVSSEVLAEWAGEEDPTQEIPELNLLYDRYQLISELGRGSQGITLLARDINTGELVAIKKLDMSALDDWKSLEFFEREISVLRSLNHAGIPKFIDAFSDEAAHVHYLVQDFIPGDTLATIIAQGNALNEELTIEILKQMLDILIYLHGRVPVVLHRDIKPSNLIWTPENRLALVDFGAAQQKVGRGTTVIGTTGYMPQEQLVGNASTSSDIYALGATMIHMITGRHPADLDTCRMVLQWREYSSINPYVTGLIARMVEPALEDRWQSAVEIKRALGGILGDLIASVEHTSPQTNALMATQPEGSGLKVFIERNVVRIESEPGFAALGPTYVATALPFFTALFNPLGLILAFVGSPIIYATFRHLFDLDTRTARVMPDGALIIDEPGIIGSTKKVVRGQEVASVEYREGWFGSEAFVTVGGETIYLTRHRTPDEAKWVVDLVASYIPKRG